MKSTKKELIFGNSIRFWGIVIIVSYLPTIVLHLLAKPMWNSNINESNVRIAIFEAILTMIIFPVYLVAINFFLARKFEEKRKYFIFNFLIVLSCIWISSYLSMRNWSYHLGYYTIPDNNTLEIIGFEEWTGYLISIIGFFIAFFNLKAGKVDSKN